MQKRENPDNNRNTDPVLQREEIVTTSKANLEVESEPVIKVLSHLKPEERARYIELYLDAICGSHSQATVNNLTQDYYEVIHGINFLGFVTEAKGSYNAFIRSMGKYCISEDVERIYALRCRENQIKNFHNGLKFSERYHEGVDAAGKPHWIRDRAMYILDETNGDVLSIGMSDIVDDEMKKQTSLENKLLDALARAEQANKAKTEFLSTMSHDIRTPMNAIIGFTHHALQQDDIAAIKESLQQIDVSCRHLLLLINDVLDISKIESGAMHMNETAFSGLKTSEKINKIIEPLAEEKHIAFNYYAHDLPHEWIISDELRINQIALNLGRNAVNYTPEGGQIDVTVWEEPSKLPGHIKYCFSVKDNGIGMSEDFQKIMYNTFVRNVDSRVNSVLGTGLGLSICKRLVELLGGEIKCDSRLNEGTTFTVALDVKIGSEPEQVEHIVQNRKMDGLRVLVAEDITVNWKIARFMLEEAGVQAERAINGKECIEILEQAAENAYDAVLMDVRMPVLDGREATKMLRQSKKEWLRRIPVIAMTADAFAEDVEACLEAGMNAHLSKPIEMEKLLGLLHQYVDKSKV